MTPVVNSLVTNAECQAGGFVAGFADPADLDPTAAAQHNQGEIFYTVVADPNGALSCAHSVADVQSFLPGTFLHELQHLISFNQHVLIRGGNQEDLWLDEALSSFAEELGGRSFLPDSTTFETYVSSDLADFPLPFPLVPPAGAGTQVNLGGTLHAGSGFYVDILQAPGAGGFALRLGGVIGLAATTVDPRLDVIRIR